METALVIQFTGLTLPADAHEINGVDIVVTRCPLSGEPLPEELETCPSENPTPEVESDYYWNEFQMANATIWNRLITYLDPSRIAPCKGEDGEPLSNCAQANYANEDGVIVSYLSLTVTHPEGASPWLTCTIERVFTSESNQTPGEEFSSRTEEYPSNCTGTIVEGWPEDIHLTTGLTFASEDLCDNEYAWFSRDDCYVSWGSESCGSDSFVIRNYN